MAMPGRGKFRELRTAQRILGAVFVAGLIFVSLFAPATIDRMPNSQIVLILSVLCITVSGAREREVPPPPGRTAEGKESAGDIST